MMDQHLKRKIYQGVIFGVAFIVAYVGTQFLLKEFKGNDHVLKDMANELNKKCPIMVDNVTRLDSASIPNDSTFQYNYTLSISKEDSIYKGESIKQFIKSNAQKNLDENPEMNYMRDNLVSLKYTYKDKNGKQLFDFNIKLEKK
jgi:hypothetical protein